MILLFKSAFVYVSKLFNVMQIIKLGADLFEIDNR